MANKVDLTGLHKVRSRLSDGSVRTYYYAYRGGPRIKADYGTPEFLAEYLGVKALGRRAQNKSKKGTVAWLVDDYLLSTKFEALSEASKVDYRSYLSKIKARFGKAPIEVLTSASARRGIREWYEGLYRRAPRAADYALAVMKALLTYAVDRDYALQNPALRIKPQHKATRRDVIWADHQIEVFEFSAPTHLVRVMWLALLTAQRKKDLLEMRWDQYDGESIRLTQSKTGKHLRFRVSRKLKAMLDGMERTAGTILTTSTGKPWGKGFDASWRKAVARAGIKGVTFHDLRGTAITRAYKLGASFREIAEMSGHSEASAEELIKAYYLPTGGVADLMDREEG